MPHQTLKLSGQSDAKGRNGYFKLAQASTCVLPNGLGGHVVHVEMQSSRTGNAAPVVLSLTYADLVGVMNLLWKAHRDFDADVMASESYYAEMKALHDAGLVVGAALMAGVK